MSSGEEEHEDDKEEEEEANEEHDAVEQDAEAFEESDDDDLELDIEGIAEKAVDRAQKIAKRMDPGQIKLDIGIGSDKLYVASNASDRFDTAAEGGIYRVNLRAFTEGTTISPLSSSPASQAREVRGAPIQPVKDRKLRRAEAKKERESKLEKWFGLPKHKMTPELEKELKAIKLRTSFDPKRFYKAHDSQELPKYFTVATEVGGGMAPVGLNTRTANVTAHSGRSFLDTVMRDQKSYEFTNKKFGEVNSRGLASLDSGHGKRKSQGAKSTHRGGAWKKKKHS
eukprot:TRINITY_DN33341_c0_g1_i1.p1 TRINITY_DN33341_c0_g1~~TRINITY_DN33341_c0_g1_i1.p1  ORF type:complete len:283 (+),score=63.90 TRINITY_DN33341_c0_g1_i1:98-946(+)